MGKRTEMLTDDRGQETDDVNENRLDDDMLADDRQQMAEDR